MKADSSWVKAQIASLVLSTISIGISIWVLLC